MARPLINAGIEQLESEFEAAKAKGDKKRLKVLAQELAHRRVPRARRLLRAVKEHLDGGSQQTSDTQSTTSSQAGAHARTRESRASAGRARNAPNYPPTEEQAEAIDLFLSGGSLKINAYAGTGKTSTLQLLAARTGRHGQYIAFNRAIVGDARDKFPSTINCATTHGLAFRATPSAYRTSKDKLFGKINANQLAELLNLKKNWRVDKDHVLAPRSQGYLILETVRRFSQSADSEPDNRHVPRHGSLLTASETTVAEVRDFAARGARHVWEKMKAPEDPIPLGYDGFLKLWALSRPAIPADFILLDEAQDTNPVVLDVLADQSAQMVYVGDKYQQIYEWRGAVNAMEKIETAHSTSLTQSFRFGEAIARGASRILTMLGEKVPVRGNPAVVSRIGSTSAQTILARTNSSAITAVIEAIDQGRSPSLVGGTTELMELLRAVEGLKNNQPSTLPEFFGFADWNEVVAFAQSGEGEHLTTFVNLVQNRGERQLMWALNRTVEEEKSDVVISTAHKAKGREWKTVRLMEDFVGSRPNGSPNGNRSDKDPAKGPDPAELRLFYVALTRAKEAVEVPSPLLPLVS